MSELQPHSARIEWAYEAKLTAVAALVTIEGVAGKIEAQLWSSAFGLDQTDVDAFEKKWQRRLQNIFA